MEDGGIPVCWSKSDLITAKILDGHRDSAVSDTQVTFLWWRPLAHRVTHPAFHSTFLFPCLHILGVYALTHPVRYLHQRIRRALRRRRLPRPRPMHRMRVSPSSLPSSPLLHDRRLTRPRLSAAAVTAGVIVWGGNPDNVEAAKQEYNESMLTCHGPEDETVSPPPPSLSPRSLLLC